MTAMHWWAWGFCSALLLVVVLDRFGIHAGAYNSGLAILLFIWCIQGANAFAKLRN